MLIIKSNSKVSKSSTKKKKKKLSENNTFLFFFSLNLDRLISNWQQIQKHTLVLDHLKVTKIYKEILV